MLVLARQQWKVILQIEVNLLWPNYELVKFSKRMGMTVTGYCCLGSPGRQAAVLKDDWPGKPH